MVVYTLAEFGATSVKRFNKELDDIKHRLMLHPLSSPREPLLKRFHRPYHSAIIKENWKIIYRYDEANDLVIFVDLWDMRRRPFDSNIKVDCFVDKGIPVLNGSNLEGFELSEKSFRYVTEEKADSLKKANAHKGDVVITHRGTLGQIVYIPQTAQRDRYVLSQSQFRVKCNKNVLPEYFVYYFHTPIGQHKLLSNASQVGVPALARPSSTFQKIEIEIPDLETQKKVVKLIGSLQTRITTNAEINDNLAA